MSVELTQFVNPKQKKRPWGTRNETLPDIEVSYGNGIRKGHLRCACLGLIRGDCQEQRLPGSIYCYYHTKALDGLVEVSEGMYAVWPLPPVPWKFISNNME
jgi:hypothetical protein